MGFFTAKIKPFKTKVRTICGNCGAVQSQTFKGALRGRDPYAEGGIWEIGYFVCGFCQESYVDEVLIRLERRK